MHHRRDFLIGAAATLAASVMRSSLAASTRGTPQRALPRSPGQAPRILLRSSWQSVNIGDIGHTPGALRPAREALSRSRNHAVAGRPGPRFARAADEGLSAAEDRRGQPRRRAARRPDAGAGEGLGRSGSLPERLRLRLPRAAARRRVSEGDGQAGRRLRRQHRSDLRHRRRIASPKAARSNRSRAKAAQAAADAPRRRGLRYIIDRAAFFFCRDTISRDYLKAQGVKTPILEFGPDAQLGMHLRDDAKGFAWLKEHGLEEGKFICVIPRLRYTPYYQIRNTPAYAEPTTSGTRSTIAPPRRTTRSCAT